MTTVTTIQPRVDAGAHERRSLTLGNAEIREDDDKLHFTGHAAVFDRLSEDLGGFRERIQRGAFRKVLESSPDVRFLLNHNPDTVLARTTSNTMTLREDPTGLFVEADLAPVDLARNLKVSVGRGDINQMSFAFRVRPDGEDVWTEEEGELVRTIIAFGELLDASLVTFPAYPQTDASMRSLCGVQVYDERGEVRGNELRELAWRIHRGEATASEEERAAVDRALARLDTVSPWVAQRALQAISQEQELQGAIQGKRAMVVLEDVTVGEPAFRLAARQRRMKMHALLTKGDPSHA